MSSRLFGITGGIGSGKSVVSQAFRIMGFPVYDCDSMAKRLMNESAEIKHRLTAMFGSDVYKNGRLDRQLLGSIIFNNHEALAAVNAVVHPVVTDDLVRWKDAQTGDACFVESAILYESGLDRLVDGVIRVDAPEKLRVARVVRRSGLTPQQVQERMANQGGSIESTERVTVIVNDDEKPVLPQIMAFLDTNL